MEIKVNYTLVGLFVTFFMVLLVALVVWLSYDYEQEDYATYVAYVYESVSGLNENAAVKYRGVDVGKVTHIALDPNNSERVQLDLAIKQGAPIKHDSVAVLSLQGITGLIYIELTGGTQASPLLQATNEQAIPEIQTAPSALVRFDSMITHLFTQLTQGVEYLAGVADRVDVLLNDDNQRAIANTLTNVEHLSRVVSERLDVFGENIDNLTEILQNTAQMSQELPRLVHGVAGSMDGVQQAVAAINQTAARLDEVVITAQKELLYSTADSLSQLNQLMEEMRQLTATLSRVAHDVERDPNMLIFGRGSNRAGPGE